MGTDNGIRNTEWERALEAKIDASGWGLFFIWEGGWLPALAGASPACRWACSWRGTSRNFRS